MAAAQTLMADRLGQALELPRGALVLDAGCGQGAVALRLAETLGLHVEGVDLQPDNIRSATRKAARRQALDRTRFQVMDYARLRFPDERFDGVYTLESLVHAPDSQAALRQFRGRRGLAASRRAWLRASAGLWLPAVRRRRPWPVVAPPPAAG